MMHHENREVFGPVRSFRRANGGPSCPVGRATPASWPLEPLVLALGRVRSAAGIARTTRRLRPEGPPLGSDPARTCLAITGILLCVTVGGCNKSFFAKPAPAIAEAPPGDSWDSQARPPTTPAEEGDDVMSEVDRFIASLQDVRSESSGNPTVSESGKGKGESATSGTAPAKHESSASDAAAPKGERKLLANASLSAEGSGAEEDAVHGSRTDPSPAASVALPVLLAISVEEEAAPVAPASPSATGLANTPAEAAPAEHKLSVEEYLMALQQGRTQLDPVEAAWRARLLEITLGRTSQGASRVDRLTPSQQDVLDASLDAVRAVRRVLRDPVASACEALEDVDRLQAVLREMSDLTIPRTALCSRVMTFGVYEQMPTDRFVAGRVNQTILYCEVRNFVSREENGEYRSKFSGRAELLTPSGDSVWKQEEPSIEDRCTSRRTDFFIAQRISFPATIPAGEYLLKVTLEDKYAGKVNETTLPLTVRSASSLATTKEP